MCYAYKAYYEKQELFKGTHLYTPVVLCVKNVSIIHFHTYFNI